MASNRTLQQALDKYRSGKSSKLNLSGLGLSKLPAELHDIDTVWQLDLSNNAFTSLPDFSQFEPLDRLNTLDISNNPLQGVVDWAVLEPLNLNNLLARACGLTWLDQSFAQLKDIYKLDLSSNDFSQADNCQQLHSTLQLWLLQNEHLEALSLRNCGLPRFELKPRSNFSDFMFDKLDLAENNLSNIDHAWAFSPEYLSAEKNVISALDLVDVNFKTCQISRLNLSQNKLVSIPAEIGYLQWLKRLDVSHNSIVALPKRDSTDQRAGFLGIDRLDLRHNPLAFSEGDIQALKDVKLVKLSHQHEERIQKLVAPMGFYWPERESIRFCQSYGGHLDLSGKKLTNLPANLFTVTHIKSLNLDNNELVSLPSDMARLVNLKSLSLKGNQLKSLPNEMAKLSQLESLDLQENDLSVVPDVVGALPQLKFLHLNNNALQFLPSSLTQANQLFVLHLGNNQLNSLPFGFDQLHSLNTLDLAHNQFSQWPADLVRLPKLMKVIIRHNQLTALPNNLPDYPQLASVYASHNSIQRIPNNLEQVKPLRLLDLSNNQLSVLPTSLFNCRQLTDLILDDNQLVILPEEGWAQLQGLASLSLDNNQLTELPLEFAQLPIRCFVSAEGNLLNHIPEEDRAGDELIKHLRRKAGIEWPGQAALDASGYPEWDEYYGYIPSSDRSAWPLWIDGQDFYYDSINGYCGFPDENDGQSLETVHPYYYPLTIACESSDLTHGQDVEPYAFYVGDLRHPNCPVLQWKRGRGFFKLANSIAEFQQSLLPYEKVHGPASHGPANEEQPVTDSTIGSTEHAVEQADSEADEWFLYSPSEPPPLPSGPPPIPASRETNNKTGKTAADVEPAESSETAGPAELEQHSYFNRDRIGQLRYVIYMWHSVWIALLFGHIGLAVGTLVLGSSDAEGLKYWAILGMLYFMVFASLQSGRRLNDIGFSSWTSMLSMIPGMNIVMWIGIALIPGNKGWNRYGGPAPEYQKVSKTMTTTVILAVLVFTLRQCST